MWDIRVWHWMSSAVCLLGMLLFAVTGITLNHAADIPSKPVVTTLEGVLDQPLLKQLTEQTAETERLLQSFFAQQKITLHFQQAQWDEEEIYLAMPGPGSDAWLSIDLHGGEYIYESTFRGAVAYLNDLHKGRHTGLAWKIFIDAFSVACLVFSVTGLVLLFRYAKTRTSTMPLLALGGLIPLLILLLFVH